MTAQLWVIECTGGGWWSDDDGGNLFTSPAMAQRVVNRYRDALERVGYTIKPCGLDDDLAQMGQLYHEGKAVLNQRVGEVLGSNWTADGDYAE